MNQVKFGWAEVDITPTEKIALRGEFFERVTNEVETPISFTALAVESDGDQAVIVSADLVGISNDLTAEAAEKLKKMGLNGLDPEKIIVSAVHTHNSYDYGYTEDGVSDVETVKKYLEPGCEYVPADHDPDQMSPVKALHFLSDKLAEAVYKAWNERKPGGFANGFGRAAVGMCRRVCYADDTAKMWGDVDHAAFTQLEGGNDNGIEMLFIYNADKKLTGVVANIACPAQVLEQRTFISSDYWGKVKIMLREKYGKDLFLLALCAPAGDQCPRDLVRWVQPETPIKDPNVIRENPKERRADPSMFDIKGTWTIARRIVNEIDYALSEVTEIKTEAKLTHVAKVIYLPLRRVTETDRLFAEKQITEFFHGKKTINYMDTAAVYVYSGILDRYEEQKTQDVVETKVNHIRFDDIAFSTSPFELFLDYGNQIRARSKAKQTFLIQLTAGDYGYLPTETAEKHGHYSAYVSSGCVGHVGGDILVRDALTEINKMFD
ncbi:MAG: hypothetical protein MJ082_01305 [Clostridia bacterium]|nr:hypothetical protein [Clostridia bacterium]